MPWVKGGVPLFQPFKGVKATENVLERLFSKALLVTARVCEILLIICDFFRTGKSTDS